MFWGIRVGIMVVLGGLDQIRPYLELNKGKIADEGYLELPLETEDHRDICMVGFAQTATFSILPVEAVVAQYILPLWQKFDSWRGVRD